MNVLCSLQMASDFPDGKTRQDKKPLFIHDHKRLSRTQTPFSTDDPCYVTAYTRMHVGIFGCTLLAFIPIDAKISRHIGFNNDEFRKETQKETIIWRRKCLQSI